MTPNERPTPLTDSNLSYGGTLVTADFARTLERSLAELKAELAAVTAERDALKHSLVRHNCGHPNCICAKCCREEDDAELSALPRLGGEQ